MELYLTLKLNFSRSAKSRVNANHRAIDPRSTSHMQFATPLVQKRPDPSIRAFADYEIREGNKIGKMKVRQRKDKTDLEKRQDLQAIWNNRSDLAKCRFYHQGPASQSQHYTNTQQHFIFDGAKAPMEPVTCSGKRHVHVSTSDPSTTTVVEQQRSRNINTSYRMNSSENVMHLIQHQVHHPSPIQTYTKSTGRRNSGRSSMDIQRLAQNEESKLMNAETNRIQRVKEAKGSMYNSDASKYFGFKSHVLKPKPRTFAVTTARNRGQNQHTTKLW